MPATIFVNTLNDTVDANPFVTSLREAVSRANATPEADTIQLPSGTFRIQRLGADNTNSRGDFDVTRSLTILGGGAGLTRIEGNVVGTRERLFDVLGPISMTFTNVSLRNGGNSQSSGGTNGGAVQALSANITLNGCVVSGNKGLRGGAINADGGTVRLNSSSVIRNESVGFGGGIHAKFAVLTNSSVSDNTSFNRGGGLYASQNATLIRTTVTRNTASLEGGGVYAFNTASVNQSTLSDNTAFSVTGFGGGLVTTNAFLNASTVNGNRAGNGAGVAATVGFLTNSTVSDNHASRNSGGVHLLQGGSLLNSTIVFNSAGAFGGGVQNFGNAVRVKNTIIARNSSVLFGRDVVGLFDSLGHNLVGDPNSGNANTDFTDPLNRDVLGVDPKLAPLAFNGGPTRTHALLTGSPAIDRGLNSGAPGIDQRGVLRPRDGNGDGFVIVDIGAFER